MKTSGASKNLSVFVFQTSSPIMGVIERNVGILKFLEVPLLWIHMVCIRIFSTNFFDEYVKDFFDEFLFDLVSSNS